MDFINMTITEFKEATKEYLKYIEVELKRSPNTVTQYKGAIGTFNKYLNDNDITEITKDTVLNYRDYLEEQATKARADGKPTNKGKRPIATNNTINLKLRTINAIFKYSDHYELFVHLLNGHTPEPEPRPGQKKKKLEKKHLNAKDYVKLLDFCDRCSNEKVKMAIKVMANTGCRISEIRDLRYKHVKSNKNRIFYTSNKQSHLSGKTRPVFIPKHLAKELRDYCKKNNITDNEAIIISNRDGTDMYSQSYIRRELKKIARYTKSVPQELTHPHEFRHVHVVNANKAGVSPYNVAQLAGHTVNTVTAIYSEMNVDELLKISDEVEEYFLKAQEEAMEEWKKSQAIVEKRKQKRKEKKLKANGK